MEGTGIRSLVQEDFTCRGLLNPRGRTNEPAGPEPALPNKRSHRSGKPRPPCPWGSPGKYTAVGYRVLLQGLLLTQGWNVSRLHPLIWQVGSLQLVLCGKP